jgi:hypothetical protein
MTTNSSPSKYPIQAAMQKFYPEYQKCHVVDAEQRKTAECIIGCKTGKLGYSVSTCTDCGYFQIHNASCNNRNCPCCQSALQDVWVDVRNSELIEDVPYYHVVFTIPSELNALVYANQKEMYNLLFHSSSQTLLKLSDDKTHLGAQPGIVSVLHTWGSALEFHPHIHTLVSGGGLTKRNTFLVASRKEFFIPLPILSSVFRGKFLFGLKKLYKKGELIFPKSMEEQKTTYGWKKYLDLLYNIGWVTFIKETFGTNGNAVKYLARYAYRTAISNARITEVTDETVSFRWKNYKNGGAMEEMKLKGTEFVRRFLLHVLPSGFTRVRFSGYLSNSKRKKKLKLIRKLTNTVGIPLRLKGLKTRELILALYHVDIGKCPCCNYDMTHGRLKAKLE